jgi:signal transduction histidine kinase
LDVAAAASGYTGSVHGETEPSAGPGAWVPRWTVDAALAVLLFIAMSLVGGFFRQPQWRSFDGWAYLLTAFICLPLAVRRQWPMLVLLVPSVAYLVFVARGYVPGLHLWGPVLALYSLAAVRTPRVSVPGAILMAPVLYLGSAALGMPPVPAVAETLTVCSVAWALGGLSRQLGVRNRQLAEVTRQLREEHGLRLAQTVTQERVRIARELHDIIAHHMSVIAMQAGLADYVFATDPPTAHEAVRTVGGLSREALEEMRRVLALLRTDDTPSTDRAADDTGYAPAPGLRQLPELLGRVQVAGVNARLNTSGELDSLQPGVQFTIYRVVQEALTNVVKHASGCDASVEVRRDAREVTVEIVNDGPPSGQGGAGHGGGYGLLGMRERARLYGGELTAGPRRAGGFSVSLVLPVR